MKKIYAMAILVAFSFAACKKEKSATEILMSHSWELEKKFENEIESLHPCEEDNVYSFNGSGNFLLQTGDIPCYVGEAATFPGMWEMNTDQTRMNVVYEGHNLTYNVIVLSPGKLEMQYYVDTVAVREVYKQH